MSVIAKAGVRIGVTEVPGTNLKRRLQKSDPFREERFGKEDCLVCAEGDGGRCRVNGVFYKITCKGCGDTGNVTKRIHPRPCSYEDRHWQSTPS